MYFRHSDDIWRDFPQLVAGVLGARGLPGGVAVDPRVREHAAAAAARLRARPEGELPEIQAWRRAFGALGLKPTQYRCASESLLRRLRKEGTLPRVNPLVDLCNAVSAAFAVPVAVFDLARISEFLEVRYATGEEAYEAFSGETESPRPGEVVFADAAGRAHARRWTNRQSASSAVRESSADVLVVAEGLHATAPADVGALVTTLAADLEALWGVRPATAILSAAAPRFEL
ncbi:MAG TPA: phenylalanine--tRNA ligase beta subunit-related protein [Gaiellaceae bacterium]|nr:phenylalanine--tRNA ligase beta subunit-related protein [Gaiellaceae bacterium]